MAIPAQETSPDPIFSLAEHASKVYDRIPEETLHKARDLFVDSLGCIYGGSNAAGVRESIQNALVWGGEKQSYIFSHRLRTSAPNAAFVNSVACHARDYDDTHDPAVNHSCVTIVPAMIAALEALYHQKNRNEAIPYRPISGKSFLTSLAVAVDVSNRIALSLIPYLYVGWLPTTIGGPFAAACAVGRLLGLDAEKMRHAFGFAYAQVHGNRQALIDGSLAKRMQPAFSAVAGIEAAFLAYRGLTSGKNILSGAYGLPVLYTEGKIDLERITDDLGVKWETDNVSIKPYPSCRCTHPVIDAALKIREEHGIKPEDIESGTIFLPPSSMGQIGQSFAVRDNPTVDAQFSAQYTAALSFLKGRPVLADFEEDRIRNSSEIISLAEKFSSTEFEKDSSGLVPIEMEVRLNAGKTIKSRIESASGSPRNPLSGERLMEKLKDNLSYAANPLSDQRQDAVISILHYIWKTEDVVELFHAIEELEKEENYAASEI